MSDGLMDFGQGAFSGGATAGKMSGGNPWAIAGGAAAGGLLSYFGGSSQRRTERKNNRLVLQGMEQEIELGDLEISAARRQDKADREARKRKETFGRLLGEYFARKQGVK